MVNPWKMYALNEINFFLALSTDLCLETMIIFDDQTKMAAMVDDDNG